MRSPRSLVRWSRSHYNPWFLRGATFGGGAMALAAALAAVIAATHPKPHHPNGLWTAGLIAVIALAAVGAVVLLVGIVGAFLTQPVSDDHCATLKASAGSVAQSIESDRACNYGDGYRPDQAFRAHFPKLARRLAAWDELISAPTKLLVSFEHDITARMAQYGIEAPTFDGNTISAYMRAFLEMSATHGDAVVQPSFQWSGFSTAGHPEIPGPPFGVLRPYLHSADWIILTPLDAESESEWQARAD